MFSVMSLSESNQGHTVTGHQNILSHSLAHKGTNAPVRGNKQKQNSKYTVRKHIGFQRKGGKVAWQGLNRNVGSKRARSAIRASGINGISRSLWTAQGTRECWAVWAGCCASAHDTLQRGNCCSDQCRDVSKLATNEELFGSDGRISPLHS